MFDVQTLLSEAVNSLRDPRRVARDLIDMGLDRGAVFRIAALVVVLSTLLTAALSLVAPEPEPGQVQLQLSPFAFAAFLGAGLLVASAALVVAGRILGGDGQFIDALLLMAWLQFILLLFQILQMFVAIISIPMSGIVFLVALLAMFWLMANFTAELHRFASLGQAAFAVFLSFVGSALVFGLLLIITGFGSA